MVSQLTKKEVLDFICFVKKQGLSIVGDNYKNEVINPYLKDTCTKINIKFEGTLFSKIDEIKSLDREIKKYCFSNSIIRSCWYIRNYNDFYCFDIEFILSKNI